MTVLDACIRALDRGLRSVAGTTVAKRPNPAAEAADNDDALSDEQRRHIAGLMRVNHCGEVCAQALYEGQALTAQSPEVRTALGAAARDEEDHLAWCRERLGELHARPSVLDPAFYVASYLLGAATGLLGDRISLGFIKATEDQVRDHLDKHLDRLPAEDAKSRAILAAMRDEEALHGDNAARAGGIDYPTAIKGTMTLASKVMTTATYRL